MKVGDKAKSKSHPKLGTMKVLAIGNDGIVTVRTPYGADDTDLDDLILVEEV